MDYNKLMKMRQDQTNCQLKFERAMEKCGNNVNLLFSDPGLKGTLHEALRPNNVHAAMKVKWFAQAGVRDLFRTTIEPLDEYRDILDKTPVDNVTALTEEGNFGFVQTQYEAINGVINGYGGAFHMTMPEMKWSRIDLVSDKMRQVLRLMKKYYDNLVMTEIKDASGGSTFDGSKWSDGTGTPIYDLEKAKQKVISASGVKPDTLLLNQATYLYLLKFDDFLQYSLLGRPNMENPNMQETLTPNGLRLHVVDDSFNAYIEDNIAYVLKAGDCGVNHVAIPFSTADAPDPNNPIMNRDYYAWEWAKPRTDKHDATKICKVTGLNT